MDTESKKVEVVKISTFHYGSIKIKTGKSFTALSKESTFHYGSIKIPSQAYESQ